MPLVGLFLNLFKILHGIEVQHIRLQGPCAVFEHSSHFFFHEGAAVLQPPGDTCISHSRKPVLVKEPSKQRPQRK